MTRSVQLGDERIQLVGQVPNPASAAFFMAARIT
jgi:hypothetical protein